MSKKTIKIQELESLLSQKIEDIYQKKLNRKLNRISCHLSGQTLIVILEGSITPPEKLLKDRERFQIAKQTREAIDRIVKPQLQDIIEEVLDVKVIDLLSNSAIEHDLTGAIAILEI